MPYPTSNAFPLLSLYRTTTYPTLSFTARQRPVMRVTRPSTVASPSILWGIIQGTLSSQVSCISPLSWALAVLPAGSPFTDLLVSLLPVHRVQGTHAQRCPSRGLESPAIVWPPLSKPRWSPYYACLTQRTMGRLITSKPNLLLQRMISSWSA